MRLPVFLLVFFLGIPPAFAAEPRGVLHTLDYLSVDYPGAVVDGRVVNEFEYAEQVEFAAKLVADLQALPEVPGKERILAQARELQRLIQAKAPGPDVSRMARQLAQAVGCWRRPPLSTTRIAPNATAPTVAGTAPRPLIWTRPPSTSTTANGPSNAASTAFALMAYLRTHPEALVDTGSVLGRARALLAQSLEAARAGDWQSAYQTAVAAYLEGFELVEPALRATQPERVAEIETLMLLYRQKVREGAPVESLSDMVRRIDVLLDQAEAHSERTGRGPQRAQPPHQNRHLHRFLGDHPARGAGSGLGAGGHRRGTHPGRAPRRPALSSRRLDRGAGRRRPHLVRRRSPDHLQRRRWREYVRERIQKALHGGTLWLLAGIAFLAVYREVFETVLFYQALWMQAGDDTRDMLWWGLGTGVVALVVLTFVILRLERRLPMRLFFSVNAAILLVLAVSFIGHGLAALQEAGWLGIHPLPLPRWELVGLYPTVETVGAQLLTLALIVWVYRRQNRQAD